MKKAAKSKKSGYIALMTALIVGAVVLVMVVTSAYMAITQGLNSLLYSNYLESESLASACAEDALIKIKNNQAYGGNETLNLGHGQCQIYPVENLGGESRIIKATGNVNGATKKIKIQISRIDPTIIFTSWQEVADF